MRGHAARQAECRVERLYRLSGVSHLDFASQLLLAWTGTPWFVLRLPAHCARSLNH
jgi:hypothetical protein